MTLQAHRLTCIRGDLELFNNLSFELEPGDALWVAGTNGSGKTSLLRMLCGLAVPAEGEVRWDGQNIRHLRDEFCSKLMYLGHLNGVKDDLLAWENLVVSSTLAGNPVSSDDAHDALEALGLGRAADLPTRALSQGQRKRVALARLSFSMSMPLWILDEPFTALDKSAVAALCGTISKHVAQGGMVVYTTHQEIDLSARRALRLDMNEGRLC
ncbi:MAG TPA: cytochrome c biogenesis heme-transporting ATPase CcmA [Noviherbaspirillum sp.]